MSVFGVLWARLDRGLCADISFGSSTACERTPQRLWLAVQRPQPLPVRSLPMAEICQPNFMLYRNHCANKTHRLRSTLKMTHGKGRDFKKLPPLTLQNIKDGQYVDRYSYLAPSLHLAMRAFSLLFLNFLAVTTLADTVSSVSNYYCLNQSGHGLIRRNYIHRLFNLRMLPRLPHFGTAQRAGSDDQFTGLHNCYPTASRCILQRNSVQRISWR